MTFEQVGFVFKDSKTFVMNCTCGFRSDVFSRDNQQERYQYQTEMRQKHLVNVLCTELGLDVKIDYAIDTYEENSIAHLEHMEESSKKLDKKEDI